MKISKLFHWLYAILMLLPFGLVLFNMLHGLFSPSATSIDLTTFYSYFSFDVIDGLISDQISSVYFYLMHDIFGFYECDMFTIICQSLTYWSCISIIWLVFDVFMYVPLLVHRWIDKAKIE